MAIEFTMIQSIGIAVVLLMLGLWLKQRIYFFERFAIPAPVIGGFLFAIINLVLHQTGILEITFDTTLQSFFMVIFFTTVGYGASLKVLRAAGPKVMLFLVVALVLTILQNVVAVGLAPLVGVDAQLALMTGSVSMTGGHGVSGGIAPLVEEGGVAGAETVAYTAATFGLVIGSLMGGPLANRLILKNKLMDKASAEVDIDESILQHVSRKLRGDAVLHAFVMILVAMLLGSFLTDAMNYLVGLLTDKAAFPLYFGSMIVAIILRYINDSREHKMYKELVPTQDVEIIGVIGLNFFLAMVLMTISCGSWLSWLSRCLFCCSRRPSSCGSSPTSSPSASWAAITMPPCSPLVTVVSAWVQPRTVWPTWTRWSPSSRNPNWRSSFCRLSVACLLTLPTS